MAMVETRLVRSRRCCCRLELPTYLGRRDLDGEYPWNRTDWDLPQVAIAILIAAERGQLAVAINLGRRASFQRAEERNKYLLRETCLPQCVTNQPSEETGRGYR